MKHKLLFTYFFLSASFSFGQLSFTRNDSISVQIGTDTLAMPWIGGHNFCQFSDIDLNFDGIKDLFVFDRTGDKITTYINNGTPNKVDYVFSDQYASKFPKMYSWAILLDYNCDGKEDIMTYAMPVAGIKVWLNTSSGGNLTFTLEKNYIKSNYNPSVSNLYVSQVDIPAIEDIDHDGDVDVLTYDFSGVVIEYHKNLSVENGYGCDSLIFQLDPNGCWGNFSENANNCSINLNQSCRMSFPHEIPPMYETGKSHSGSCILCLDMDADKDKDIIVGDVSCCNMTLLTNGGDTSAANMTAFEDSFPANTKFVQMGIFPCGYSADVNNDGKRDFLVSPNQPNTSLDKESIWYYQNINSDSTPVFSYVKDNFLQDEMIDVGEGAYPVLFDYNSDGLIDLLVSNSQQVSDSCLANASYNMDAFKNIGTSTNPFFILDTNDFASLSAQLPSVTNLYPTFGDLDNDGDADMMIGDYSGKLFYFTNTAGAGNPCNFVLTQSAYPDGGGNPIDVGLYAAPQLIDMNRDSLLDLVIGEKSGNLNYYENSGTKFSPLFFFMTDSFGKVKTASIPGYGYSIPFMFDYYGKYKLFSGRNDGNIFAYDSIDGNLNGSFVLSDSALGNIHAGLRSAVTGADINGDLSMDLMVGNFCGGVSFYKGFDSLLTNIQTHEPSFNFSVFPNPANDLFSFSFSENVSGRLTVLNSLGEILIASTIKNSYSYLLNVKSLSNGVYVLRFCSSAGTQSKMVCISR